MPVWLKINSVLPAIFDSTKDSAQSCNSTNSAVAPIFATLFSSFCLYSVANQVTMVFCSLIGTTGRVVDDAEEKMGRMLRQFQEHVHNKFNMYAFVFFGCEVANLVIALTAIYATHLFFNNQFLTYGTSVWR